MSLASDLLTYLKTKPAITSLVGEGAAARIYEGLATQAEPLPYVIFTFAFGGQSMQHLGGIGGLAESVLHVWAFAANPEASRGLAEDLRLCPLQCFRGTMGGTFISVISAAQHFDCGVEPHKSGGELHKYWTRRVYNVFHSEAVSA